MTIRFSIIAILLSFAIFTSCESDESQIAPFTAEQVAVSPEWKDYSDQVDRMMSFMVSGSIDMDKVQALSNATPDGPEYGIAMKSKVTSIPGGPEYLTISKQVDNSRQRVMNRFGVVNFDPKMTEEINKAYRKVRSTTPGSQHFSQR